METLPNFVESIFPISKLIFEGFLFWMFMVFSLIAIGSFAWQQIDFQTKQTIISYIPIPIQQQLEIYSKKLKEELNTALNWVADTIPWFIEICKFLF